MSDNIAPAMTENEALRRIVARLDSIIDWLLGKYTKTVGESFELTANESTVLRAAKNNALKTVVTNTGESEVQVFEGGFTVGIIGPSQSWESPLSGRLLIEATSRDEDGEVSITTYLKP